MDTFHPECSSYNSIFNEYFIAGDKTWKMAQILALVSCGAGCLATLVIWMMIITPIPSCFFWPGILLPAVLLQLLSGSARFVFFDTQICHEQLWVPDGENAVPVQAESCALMTDSIISIATSVLSLTNVLMICLRAPKRRQLDENYGMRYKDFDNDMLNLRTDTMEDSTCKSVGKDLESQQSSVWNSPENVKSSSAFDLEAIVSQQMQTADYSPEPIEYNKRSKAKKHIRKNSINKADVKTEQLRTVERSIDYTSPKEFEKVMSGPRVRDEGENDENSSLRSRPKSTRSTRSSFKPAEGISHTDVDYNFRRNTAPSDEGNFGFRSPLKAFKGNFSPKKSIPKSKSDNWSGASTKKNYDEDKIMKCVADLENSFS